MIIGFVVQHRLKKTVAQQMQVQVANGMSGEQVARQILDRNGLAGVPGAAGARWPAVRSLRPAQADGATSRRVSSTARRSRPSRSRRTRSGHAIQHEKAYGPFKLRSAMWPAVAFASNAWLFLLLIGAFAGAVGLVQFAIILFAVVVVFQLVTLPVEFDASRRALAQLNWPIWSRRVRPRARRRCSAPPP